MQLKKVHKIRGEDSWCVPQVVPMARGLPSSPLLELCIVFLAGLEPKSIMEIHYLVVVETAIRENSLPKRYTDQKCITVYNAPILDSSVPTLISKPRNL